MIIIIVQKVTSKSILCIGNYTLYEIKTKADKEMISKVYTKKRIEII